VLNIKQFTEYESTDEWCEIQFEGKSAGKVRFTTTWKPDAHESEKKDDFIMLKRLKSID